MWGSMRNGVKKTFFRPHIWWGEDLPVHIVLAKISGISMMKVDRLMADQLDIVLTFILYSTFTKSKCVLYNIPFQTKICT